MLHRFCVLAAAAVHFAEGFYLPGVAPRDYLPGERVELKVNKLSSTKTQLVRIGHARESCPAHLHGHMSKLHHRSVTFRSHVPIMPRRPAL